MCGGRRGRTALCAGLIDEDRHEAGPSGCRGDVLQTGVREGFGTRTLGTAAGPILKLIKRILDSCMN